MEEIDDKPRVVKRKPGRPRIKKGKLSETFTFRVTYQEALGIKRKAEEAGIDWADYLRALVRADLEHKLHAVIQPPTSPHSGLTP